MIKVAQCWDDGLETDIRLIEILRRHDAKATFNLNPGLIDPVKRVNSWVHQGFQARHLALPEVKSVYEGFTMASHNWKHECANVTSPDVFVRSALDARHWLEDLFQKDFPGFAWPCGQFNDAIVKAMKSAGFAYGRTCRNTDDVTACPEPMLLDSNCHFANPDFRKKFELAKKFGCFYFWGHSCEMHDDSALWNAYEENIVWLSSNPEVQWVDVVDLVKR